MDIVERIKRAAVDPPVKLPSLSPPFVSPDDAARFAHELVGDHREVEYGGIILRNQLDQYFATRPVRGKAVSFDLTLVLPVNERHQPVLPAGYSYYANYHSHPNNFNEVKSAFKHWSAEQVLTGVSFFSSLDLYSIINLLRFKDLGYATVYYLSGGNGSLLKYEASGSVREASLLKRIIESARVKKQPYDDLVEYIKAVADSGRLSIVQSSAIWRGRTGVIDSAFEIFSADDYVPDKGLVQRPAYGPVLTSEELALNYARTRIDGTPEQHYGFILKHRSHSTFVVTEPVTGTMDFSLDRAFTKTANGKYMLASGFTFFGLYGCDKEYRDRTTTLTERSSLFENFMPLAALSKGVQVAQSLAKELTVPALPLFIATRDGAFLKYVSKASLVEKTLLTTLLQAEQDRSQVLKDLILGRQKNLELVHALAETGELSVLFTSELWSQKGRVTTQWQPFTGFMRRTLGPGFINADDAANYAHEQIAGRVDAVYGGLIFQGLDNRFFATEPLAVGTQTFDRECVFPSELPSFIPVGAALVAVYQSRRVQPQQLWRSADEEQLSRNMFSPYELYTAISNNHWVGSYYFSTQNGTLLKYTVKDSEWGAPLLADVSAPQTHPEQVLRSPMQLKLSANTLKPSEYIARAARAGELKVIVGSALWGPRGNVKPDWKPSPALSTIPEGAEVPLFSPIFSQALDAMRYVHGRMGKRMHRQFGFILKSTHSEEYIATEPLSASGEFLPQVFPRPFGTRTNQLPEGFIYHALYLAAPKVPKEKVSDEVYAGFMSPRDMNDALVRVSSAHDQVPGHSEIPVLYLSTAEGALLSYRPDNLSTELVLGVFKDDGKDTTNELLSHKISAVNYVRRVASSGQLHVLLKSRLWATAGRVSAGWRPYALDISLIRNSSPNVHALGPVFRHIDDAARYCHQRLPHPHKQEVLGAILRHSAYNLYVAVEPLFNGLVVNAAESIFLNALFERSTDQNRALPVFPAGYVPWAVYFAHPPRVPSPLRPNEQNWSDNVLWPADICYVTQSLKRLDFSLDILFLSGNDGALLKYVRRPGKPEDDLCELVPGWDYWENHYLEQEKVSSGTETESVYIAKLVKAGELVVVVPSVNWPRVGWITANWKEYEPVKVSPQLPWLRSPSTVVKDEL